MIEGTDLKVELNEQSRMEPVLYTVGEQQTDFHEYESSDSSSELEQQVNSTELLFKPVLDRKK